MSDASDDSLKSPDGSRDSSPSFADEDFKSSRNASEIAGETTEVVGANTGRFPRVPAPEPRKQQTTSRAALMVGAGILLSRIIGLVRQRVFGHYLGLGDAAGAFAAAFRIPNFLQNIFGE